MGRIASGLKLTGRPLPLLVAAAIGIVAVMALAKPPAPPVPTPCTGSPIEINNRDFCGITKTIKIYDSSAVCDILCAYNIRSGTKGKPVPCTCQACFSSWIGSIVIADPSAPQGFRFDSTTIMIAENTAEGMQTSTCLIEQYLGTYAGGFWFVPYYPAAIGNLYLTERGLMKL